MLGDMLLGIVGVVGLLLLRVLEWGEHLLLALRKRRAARMREGTRLPARTTRPTDFAELR